MNVRRRIPRRLSALVILALAVPDLAPPSTACTTFCLSDGRNVVFGRNYDWDFGDALLMVNKRGVTKVSAFGAPGSDPAGRIAERGPGGRAAAGSRSGETPARWVSKYGSVTFNQYGREFPTGGMNEKGLV